MQTIDIVIAAITYVTITVCALYYALKRKYKRSVREKFNLRQLKRGLPYKLSERRK